MLLLSAARPTVKRMVDHSFRVFFVTQPSSFKGPESLVPWGCLVPAPVLGGYTFCCLA